MKQKLKKIGKAVWCALPWVGLTIWLFCLWMLPVLHANERGELEAQIAALKAENQRYEAEYNRLDNEVEWLRSLIKQEDGDGQS